MRIRRELRGNWGGGFSVDRWDAEELDRWCNSKSLVNATGENELS